MKEPSGYLGKNILSKGNSCSSQCKGPEATASEEQQEATVAGYDPGMTKDKVRE